MDRFEYNLNEVQKNQISKNLIEILQNDAKIEDQTSLFITNWIMTGPKEKESFYYDVWDIVLKTYLPTKRPLLFRSCNELGKNNEIKSFTGRFECVNKFSKREGLLIICDTNETMRFEDELYSSGSYRKTFYPLGSVLKRSKEAGGKEFSERFLNEYIGEDEYIMRLDFEDMHILKWT